MLSLPFSRPEVVGKLPEGFFEDVRKVLPIRGVAIEREKYFYMHDMTKQIFKALNPCIEMIQEYEGVETDNMRFSVHHGLVLPGTQQRKGRGYGRANWHKDGAFGDNVHRYTASDILCTKLLSIKPVNPGELIRFDRKVHCSPINKTNEPVYRTWLRVEVVI